MEQNNQQIPTAEPPAPSTEQGNEVSVSPSPNPSPVPTATSPQQSSEFTNVPAKSSSNKPGLIIGIIVAIVVLIGAMAAAWFLFLSPEARAKRASNAFMTAATNGDLDELYELAKAEDDETKNFLKSASESVEGDFKLDKKDKKDGKYYFLYELTNEKNKYARTIVENDDGFGVTSFVYGANELAVIPGNSDSDDETQEEPAEENEQVVASVATNQCLVQSDFDAWYKAGYGKTATEYGFNFHKPANAYTTNVHFPPDSLEYEGFDNTGAVENIAQLAKHPDIINKQFTVRLWGSVGTSQADADFANKRAERIKTDLIAKGVPVSKIVVDPPKSATDYEENPNALSRQTMRVVVLKFDPTCNTTESSVGR